MTWRPPKFVGLVLAVALVTAAATGGWRLNRPFPDYDEWFTGQVPGAALVIDARGSISYAQGHIPDAPRLWSRSLLSYSAALPGMLKSGEEIARLVSALGLEPGREVVVYDQGGGAGAPLVVMVLTGLGIKARVLAGGFDGWVAGGGPVSQEPVPPAIDAAAGDWALDGALLAAVETVRRAQTTGDAMIADARGAIDFGAGHLEMAVHLPADQLAPDGTLARWSEATWLVAPTGIQADTPVVVYGADLEQAARAWLSLRAYGVGRVQVFAGPFQVLVAAGLRMESASAGSALVRSASICFGAAPTGPQ